VFLNTKIMGIKQYINETKAEMKHVTWPTSRQTMAYSILVVVVSVVIAAYLGALDSLFTAGIKSVISGF
jgi:preprotein translocase subunit SecE